VRPVVASDGDQGKICLCGVTTWGETQAERLKNQPQRRRFLALRFGSGLLE